MAKPQEEFLAKMKAQFDELNYKWNIERNKIEAKAQHLSGEAKKKFEAEWEALDQLRRQMKEKIIDLEVAGENGKSETKYYLENVRFDKPFVSTEAPHTWQTRGYYKTQTWWRDGPLPVRAPGRAPPAPPGFRPSTPARRPGSRGARR